MAADIRRDALLEAPLEDVERLARFMGVQLHAQPDRSNPRDLREYKFALCDQIARRTDRKYFRR